MLERENILSGHLCIREIHNRSQF